MSERRTLLSRPRTRVYDCNYNIGEGYYKPMMDHLDRKYYGTAAAPTAARPASGGLYESPKNLFASTGSPSAFDEYGLSASSSSSTPRSRRSGSDSRLSLADDDFEQEVAALRKARAARAAAARTASLEKEFESAFNGFADGKPRARLNYAEKMLDTVGLNSRSQDALEEEILRKRAKSLYGRDADEAADKQTRWTAAFKAQLRDAADERSADEVSAAARARKSKARLLDIQNELDGIGEREAARQKRSADLRALFADNEALTESVTAYTKKSSKKVSF